MKSALKEIKMESLLTENQKKRIKAIWDSDRTENEKRLSVLSIVSEMSWNKRGK